MKTIVQLVEELKEYLLEKDTAAKQAVESNIAPVEADASSASRTYVVGEQLLLNDVLYDVTSPISVGDAIAVGTNITAANKLSADIQSKQDQIEVTTMPTASASNVGKVLIYIGATTSTYTSGQSYQSTLEGGNYIWKPTSISSVDASDVVYDNQTSGLTATDSQAAIDELASQNQTLTNKVANEIATRAKVSGHNIGKITTPSQTGLTGLDFTVNSDGSIKVNGTSTAACSFIMNNAMLLKAGSYTLSSGIGANPNLYVQITNKDQSASLASTDNSAEATFTLNVDTIVVYRIFYLSGQTFNNVVVKPMIRLATDESADYEPYSMTNQEITALLPYKTGSIIASEAVTVNSSHVLRFGQVISVHVDFTVGNTAIPAWDTSFLKIPSNILPKGITGTMQKASTVIQSVYDFTNDAAKLGYVTLAMGATGADKGFFSNRNFAANTRYNIGMVFIVPPTM